MEKILIVDDEKLIRKSLKIALEQKGYTALTSQSGEKGLAIVENERVDVVLLDIRLPDSNGIDILKSIKNIDSDIVVIIMTGYGTIDNAVRAMKLGAFDYITKPFKEKDITTLVRLALETNSLKREIKRFIDQDRKYYGLDKIVGRSETIQQTIEMVKKVSRANFSTVLIEGESGTGKELVAKAIHYNSARQKGAFIEINCAAMPPLLLESELFGYEKGAFTDAKKTKKGLFEEANGGSLFLDEIGDMDVSMQVKILNVLQERKFRRLGGNKLIEIDVRIIAATNHNLREEVKNKTFREDLFYRLNVIHIFLAALRNRKDDIQLLTKYFINEFNTLLNKNVKDISDEALNVLISYSWPGNVRELRNIIERIMIIHDPEVIMPEHVPLERGDDMGHVLDTTHLVSTWNFHIPDTGVDIKKLTGLFQAGLIENALKQSNGSKTKTAQMLNIDRFALRYFMKKLGIDG